MGIYSAMAATLLAAHWRVVLQESFLLYAQLWITGDSLLLTESFTPIMCLLKCQVVTLVTQLVTHQFLSF